MRKELRKTPVAKKFLQQLIKVNDQICFFSLIQWEFNGMLEGLAKDKSASYTPEVFPDNPFSENVFRKVGDLSGFSKESARTALHMGVISGVEHCIAFVDEVEAFREKLMKKPSSISDDAKEEQIRLKIEAWSGRAVEACYFLTLGYFRHLRNHYAHLNEKPVSAFRSCISNSAARLNRFWGNGITDLKGVDFKVLAATELTPALAFGIMNLLRICVAHIDHLLAETIDESSIVDFEVDRFFRIPLNRGIVSGRASSKISVRLLADWNLKVGAAELAAGIERSTERRRESAS